jgi:hypothetical protein
VHSRLQRVKLIEAALPSARPAVTRGSRVLRSLWGYRWAWRSSSPRDSPPRLVTAGSSERGAPFSLSFSVRHRENPRRGIRRQPGIGCWGIVSFGLLSYYGISLRRLAAECGAGDASIGNSLGHRLVDVGPAFFGWWRPRVVFPRWLLTAPGETADGAAPRRISWRVIRRS